MSLSLMPQSLMPRLKSTFRKPIWLLGAVLFTAVAQAHDSPEHSIEDLTAHIQQEGESVPLLLLRASHYRVLGQNEKAIADLTRVLQLQPDQEGALVELSRIHLAMNKLDDSLQWIERAIATAGKNETNNAHLYAARGDVYLAKADYARAQADYNRAIAGDSLQVDWYLNRSWAQGFLNLSAERIKGLSKGYEATHSVVLQNEWIEALIDGGQAQQALRIIEPQLQQSRLQSTWLIRRARARLALGSKPEYSAAAHNDLKAAIKEINLRLRPSRPDTDLLLNRALASLLLGNIEAAQQDAAMAETYGADARQLEKWQRLVQRYTKGNPH